MGLLLSSVFLQLAVDDRAEPHQTRWDELYSVPPFPLIRPCFFMSKELNKVYSHEILALMVSGCSADEQHFDSLIASNCVYSSSRAPSKIIEDPIGRSSIS